MVPRNKRAVVLNSAQGTDNKVLCVCSAGVLRGPTAARLLSMPPFNFNTRACGDNVDYALIPLTEALVLWADEIVCMEQYQVDAVSDLLAKAIPGSDVTWPVVHCLNVEDEFDYMDPNLVKQMMFQFKDIFGVTE